jgi:subtilisin family serine protease
MRQGRLLVVLLAAACGTAGVPAAHGAEPGAGELLVRFDPSLSPSDRAEVRRRADTPVERALPLSGLQVVQVPGGADARSARADLERAAGVLYVEPNFTRSFEATPNDPHFGLLWGLHNTGQTVGGTAGTADADIDAPEAWDVTTGSAATTVAIVDSGIDAGHPDLAPQMWSNPGESGAGKETNGVDDDQNGYVDDYRGWDWASQDGDPDDENGHGTHVAGTVAARGNDGQGVTGVSWQARLMALRALDENGEGTVADVVDAYAYAAAQGAPIVNASLGATGFSFTEYDMLRSLPGTLFVVAAGNDGESNETNPHYPCSYDLANIVCVAASNNRDGLAGFSNYGATTVDLAAPGRSILSTWPGGYAYASGTSMATPQVAGVAALVHSHLGGASAATMRNALLAGVDAKPAFAGKTVTGGRLNAAQSLGVPAPAPPPPAAPAPAPGSTDRIRPQVVVALGGTRRIRTVTRRGLRTVLRCSEACVVRVDTFVGRSTAHRLGIATSRSRKRIGGAYARLSSAHSKVVVARLDRSAARRLNRASRRRGRPSFRLEVRIRAADLAGNQRSLTRALRLH